MLRRALVLAALALPGAAAAQPTLKVKDATPTSVAREGDYGGVTPGKPDERKRKTLPKSPTLMWVGFQRLEGGANRIFLQSNTPLTFEQAVVGEELVVRVPHIALDLKNNARPLDTRFFPGTIAGVGAKPAKGGVEVRIRFKTKEAARQAAARNQAGDDGVHYLFLDFEAPAP
jgi:hypothetical protein